MEGGDKSRATASPAAPCSSHRTSVPPCCCCCCVCGSGRAHARSQIVAASIKLSDAAAAGAAAKGLNPGAVRTEVLAAAVDRAFFTPPHALARNPFRISAGFQVFSRLIGDCRVFFVAGVEFYKKTNPETFGSEMTVAEFSAFIQVTDPAPSTLLLFSLPPCSPSSPSPSPFRLSAFHFQRILSLGGWKGGRRADSQLPLPPTLKAEFDAKAAAVVGVAHSAPARKIAAKAAQKAAPAKKAAAAAPAPAGQELPETAEELAEWTAATHPGKMVVVSERPSTFTAFPCVFTVFPCVFSASPCVCFTAFPCVFTAFLCVFSAFPCVFTASNGAPCLNRWRSRQASAASAGDPSVAYGCNLCRESLTAATGS